MDSKSSKSPKCHQRKAELDTAETARNRRVSRVEKESWLAIMGLHFVEGVYDEKPPLDAFIIQRQ
jgi:hypothetical protein